MNVWTKRHFIYTSFTRSIDESLTSVSTHLIIRGGLLCAAGALVSTGAVIKNIYSILPGAVDRAV